MIRSFLAISFLTIIISCRQTDNHLALIAEPTSLINNTAIVNEQGATIQTRFSPPPGFTRTPVDEHSFAYYLRHLPLKPAGSKVKYYNGEEKDVYAYVAVVDMSISAKDLQQCADAVMRLRGEYFYAQKQYDSICFVLTNDFETCYSEWRKGNRIAVSGNKTTWQKRAAPSNTYNDFRNYMDLVFSYAGTLSLSKTLHSKSIKDIDIGDVFIEGGFPGHAVIVLDVAVNKEGEKVFMLAQSYMPAQETQVLKNGNDESINPWYSNKIAANLVTPQWTFGIEQLKTW